jgi:hypothetical protein
LATGSTGTRFTEGSSDDGRCYRQVRKRVFLRSHFILNMIILPRQARDKHRESTQKRVVFSAEGLEKLGRVLPPPPPSDDEDEDAAAGLDGTDVGDGGAADCSWLYPAGAIVNSNPRSALPTN